MTLKNKVYIKLWIRGVFRSGKIAHQLKLLPTSAKIHFVSFVISPLGLYKFSCLYCVHYKNHFLLKIYVWKYFSFCRCWRIFPRANPTCTWIRPGLHCTRRHTTWKLIKQSVYFFSKNRLNKRKFMSRLFRFRYFTSTIVVNLQLQDKIMRK
jgi:hypothetical protein